MKRGTERPNEREAPSVNRLGTRVRAGVLGLALGIVAALPAAAQAPTPPPPRPFARAYRGFVCMSITTAMDSVPKPAADLLEAFRNAPTSVISDNLARLQCANSIQRADPPLNATVTTFHQVLVHAVVDRIARDYQPDRGHVKNRCVVCIGVSHLDNAQFATFQVERVIRRRP